MLSAFFGGFEECVKELIIPVYTEHVFQCLVCISIYIPVHVSVQVCNSCGQVGYVPERYVQYVCLPAEDSTQLDSSFSSTSSTGNKERAGSRGQSCVYVIYSTAVAPRECL